MRIWAWKTRIRENVCVRERERNRGSKRKENRIFNTMSIHFACYSFDCINWELHVSNSSGNKRTTNSGDGGCDDGHNTNNSGAASIQITYTSPSSRAQIKMHSFIVKTESNDCGRTLWLYHIMPIWRDKIKFHGKIHCTMECYGLSNMYTMRDRSVEKKEKQ